MCGTLIVEICDLLYLYSDLLDKLQNPTSLYIVLNIIDSVLALENKRKKAAAANDFKDGQKGMAIFMHSIAVIS